MAPVHDPQLPADHACLIVHGSDKPGIVAAVSTLLFEAGCNILDAQQFDDVETGRFFMRVSVVSEEGAPRDTLRDALAPIAGPAQTLLMTTGAEAGVAAVWPSLPAATMIHPSLAAKVW